MRWMGVTIMSVFASVWCLWALAVSGGRTTVLDAVPILVSALLIVVAAGRRAKEPRSPAEQRKAINRLVAWVSGIEGVAIFIVANLLANMGLAGFIVPATAIIVGLHFWPLARGMRVASYYVNGAALTTIGVTGLFIPDPHIRVLTVGFGVAFSLWLTCIARLWLETDAPVVA